MAKLLGVSSRTVRRRIEDGTIKATRASNGRFYISQREAEHMAYAAERKEIADARRAADKREAAEWQRWAESSPRLEHAEQATQWGRHVEAMS